MNWNKIEGNWDQFKGKVQQQWGKLTDDEVQQAKGDRQRLVGLVKEKYGMSQEAAEDAVESWRGSLDS
jgi:uncharacterized protein YjbJ (UPF0337 family)